jgi:penicillin-binding protein 1A
MGSVNDVPTVASLMPPLTSPKYTYQLMRMLQQAVERGAAINARVPGHTIIGKTGTSQNYFDAWFVGGTSQLAVGIVVGFDTPRSLGKMQTGSAVAAPIFADFYRSIAHLYPSKPFPVPLEVQTAWIDTVTTPLVAPSTAEMALPLQLPDMPIDEGKALQKGV